MVNNFDTSAIEIAAMDTVYGIGVTKNVFANRPRSSRLDLADFIVCKVTGRINDLRAFGRCTLSVHLFAADVANMKNAARLSAMQEAVINGMPRSVGNLLIDDVPHIIGDTTDRKGYHARIINYDLILKIV